MVSDIQRNMTSKSYKIEKGNRKNKNVGVTEIVLYSASEYSGPLGKGVALPRTNTENDP